MLYDTPFPTAPQTDLVPAQTERNAAIRARHAAGETVGNLARDYALSPQRISQILRGRRR
jgi:Mor family transcriptional regulator